MGNTAGKLSAEEQNALHGSFHNLSGHANLSEREASSAWYRYGVSVTDVYDVVEVLGQGHMGEVFTVRRKITGHHTDLTRERMRESEDDLKQILKKAEESNGKTRGAKKKAEKITEPKRNSHMVRSLSTGSTPIRKSRRSLMGAAHKAKKVIKKVGRGDGKGAAFEDDENSNLAMFIKSDDAEELSQHIPPSTTSATPLKSIMREGPDSKFSNLPSNEHSDDVLERSISENSPFARKITFGEGSNEIIKASKGVHFQRTFAVKTILTSRVNKDQLQELVNEIMIMRKLDHPFVLKLYEVYHVKRKLWLVTELLTGGDLSSRKLNEHDTKNVIEQVLRALVYLHRMGIVHRDIKLENVLYENHSKQATVRLIDFGLSRTFDRTSVAADYARTPYTMSPEAAASKTDEKLTDKTDVWAVGVITFIMLSGEFPFIKTNADTKDQNKMDKLKQAKFHFGITWKGRGITGTAKEFVKGCLQADPIKRWTAKEALQHLQNSWAPEVDKIWDEWLAEIKKNKKPEYIQPQDLPGDEDDEFDDESREASSQSGHSWLDENDHEPPPAFDAQARARYIKKHVQKVAVKKKAEGPINLNESVKIDMDEIERYTKFGSMKKTILITMANTMDRGDVGKLRELFLKSDTEDTGTITLKELMASFRKVSPEVDEKRVEEVFAGIDRDKSGEIHYAEFLAALAESHGLVTLDRLTEAFDRIDTDGKGYITHEDLKSILGKDYDKVKVDMMIEEGDFKKNNKIDYEELLQLMFSDPVKGDELAGSVVASPAVSFG
eukprot:CAMPEP_0172556826 /NCGR_PEP_ID=MMETSP1067-20121228/69247_1 /TAXON_ID=265564 ORGANISM="Thalassiosira punctigera, Strain Tpunct2005C2" /NCGR_SAMPLE_ID=MMETSP1067 /ASSEMBLY_ACC=CAM_ASM_000444 /LENGTH=779 /DNA_ID=CAMNT_0013345729 /DNA_START=78 /DNA_END=2414 /DNA_ORIENTATION=-